MDKRENFGSKMGAILAAAGSAVGLGNVWRFPIETGQNGGAAYIIIYILCIILLGFPVMVAEFVIGKYSQSNAAGAYQKLAPGTWWKWVGRLGVFTGFVIISYYAVVAGWTMEYATLTISNQFADKNVGDYAPLFNGLVSNPWYAILWTVLAFLVTHIVITRGVKQGIEKFSKILMPMLFIITIILVICSVTLPGASGGIDFLIRPDFSKINAHIVLNALGQAFYSLSLGMGALITYSSYFTKETSLHKTATQVCIIDTFVALMAGFIIFPAMWNAGYSLQPEDIGPSLIFITLPNVFGQSFAAAPVVGYIFSVLFYLLLFVAAVTSMMSLHEVVTAYFHDEFKMERRKAATVVTIACTLLGIGCALSFGPMKDFRIFNLTFFDLCDYVSSNILLPVGGLLTAVFVGWYLDKRMPAGVWNLQPLPKRIIRILIRYVAPVAIFGIILCQFGIL